MRSKWRAVRIVRVVQMVETICEESPADKAARTAWVKLRSCLDDGLSFVFEAGAGAGKTYSLVAALRHLLSCHGRELQRSNRYVACVTYTNVARDMILAQTDGHPAVYCDTTHAFVWLLISPFQKQLCAFVPELQGWAERRDELIEAQVESANYALGRRSVNGKSVSLHHDDIFPLFIRLMDSPKFVSTVRSRFPVILVDEYQDTNAALVECLKERLVGDPRGPQIGFFGDHWQKIYGDGCGFIDHDALIRIDKQANFRSAAPIVECLNRIRPGLAQEVHDPASAGSVRVFHTNGWGGKRLTANHWQNDLPASEAAKALSLVRKCLMDDGWRFEKQTKILMLTHRALANELGYSSMRSGFQFNDSFTRKADTTIAYFHEHLEPAARAFLAKQTGRMFEAIDAERPVMRSHSDKIKWSAAMNRLCELRQSGTVGDVLCHLASTGLPILSDAVMRQESALLEARANGETIEGRLKELQDLHAVSYREIIALCDYLDGHSPFETKHGVKGDQFENVLVVFGRGWNEYDFNLYLQMANDPSLIASRQTAYERYRNLFYVAVSRPRRRLALLFTHKLDPQAIRTIQNWFAGHAIEDIGSSL